MYQAPKGQPPAHVQQGPQLGGSTDSQSVTPSAGAISPSSEGPSVERPPSPPTSSAAQRQPGPDAGGGCPVGPPRIPPIGPARAPQKLKNPPQVAPPLPGALLGLCHPLWPQDLSQLARGMRRAWHGSSPRALELAYGPAQPEPPDPAPNPTQRVSVDGLELWRAEVYP